MKDTILAAKWSKRENDLMIHYPRRCDGALLNYVFGDIMTMDFNKWADTKYDPQPPMPYKMFNFLKELESRGYDIKTLKFSIELKKLPENQ